MANSFGKILTVTLFGESHGPCVGAVVDGLPAGLPVSREAIGAALRRKQPMAGLGTARVERDDETFTIDSGIFHDRTTGAPVVIRLPNREARPEDYAGREGIARPGHADYTAQCRFGGFQDTRGGGHFSGRLTAGLVAAAALVEPLLAVTGITVGSHIARLGGIPDAPIPGTDGQDPAALAAVLRTLREKEFPTVDAAAGETMREAIRAAAAERDSVGGVIETVLHGVPAGLGEPCFDTLEGTLARGLFGIPGVVGVSFGDGFAQSDRRGSENNDALYVENGQVGFYTNHAGGIFGGISCGGPIRLCCAVKPTPSIGKEQPTVDFLKQENTTIVTNGRHDPCIVPRVLAVVESVCALTIADFWLIANGNRAFRAE